MLKRLLLVLVPVMAFQAPAQSTTFVFGPRVDVRFEGSTAVAVADFNGDGRDDIAAAARRQGFGPPLGYLEVSLQGSDGSLAPVMTLQAPAPTGAVKAARLRPDGPTEILVGHEQGLAVYRWDGTGGFTLDNHQGAYACWSMAVADLDADGATDVLCLGSYTDAMLFYGNSAAGFEPPRYMQTAGGAGGAGGQLKDATGDGRLDLLLASASANSFFVYPNDGARGFLPAVAYPYPEEAYLWPTAIEALDLDGDGANEVIVPARCNMPCAALYTYRQGTQGYLELSQRTPTLDIPGAFLASDVDGNGRQDLVVGHVGWSTVGRYMGKGQGQGLPATELWSSVPVQYGSSSLATGDLNHDGYADLAVANSFGVSVLYGGRQATSDFNGDFVSDLVWRSGNGDNVLWLSADSAQSQLLQAKDSSWLVQAIGDFDGDGWADLFWRNKTTGANEILSHGSAWIEPTSSVASQDLQVVGAGDFDGDGRSDLIWRNSVSGVNTIWKSGSSATPQAMTSVTDLRWKVAGTGDFDGDGQSDILWRHSTSGSNGIWRSARADVQQGMAAMNLQWTVAGISDFNGDRKDDVAWRNTSTGANVIWLSANSATPMAVTSVTNQAWTIAAVGDYDGDERADLLWRNSSNGSNVIWHSADSRQTQAVTSITGWNVVR